MTKLERDRGSRRTTLVALGVSAVLHAAALLWLGLPIPALDAPAEQQALLPPLMAPVMLDVETPTPSVAPAAEAQVADAGAAGQPGPADAAPPRTEAIMTAAADAPRPVDGEQFRLAALDSLMNAERLVQPAAEAAPLVVATLPAATSTGTGQAAQPAAPSAPVHIPGSAAKAKGGGASAGAGPASSGIFGGITVKVGPKKHPPRGLPGRGRW